MGTCVARDHVRVRAGHAMTTGGPGDTGLSLDGIELANATSPRSSPRSRRRTCSRARCTVRCRPPRRSRSMSRIGAPRRRPVARATRTGATSTGETWRGVPVPVGNASHREVPRRVSPRSSTTSRAAIPTPTIIAVTHGGIVGDYLGGHQDWPHCGITELEVDPTRLRVAIARRQPVAQHVGAAGEGDVGRVGLRREPSPAARRYLARPRAAGTSVLWTRMRPA